MSSTIGTGLQAGHVEPSRVHADRHLRDGAETAMNELFNWQDKSGVVIERVDAVAVYQNEYGNVVIRQQAYDGDDAVIIIPRSRLDDLILALRNEASA